MRKRSLERQDTTAQYDEYVDGSNMPSQLDDFTSLYSSEPNNMPSTRMSSGIYLNDYGYGQVVPGNNTTTEDRQWDSGGYGSITCKILPTVPLKNSFSISENMGSPNHRGATLPPTPSYSKKSRLLPQPQTVPSVNLPPTPRMLPQMPYSTVNNSITTPAIRRSDTEYSDQDSLHSMYSYRPGAVSAMQFNEDYNYAYQSTDSLNTQSALSECGGRRKGAILPSVPNSQIYRKYAQSTLSSTVNFDIDITAQNSGLNNDDCLTLNQSNYLSGTNDHGTGFDYGMEIQSERKNKKLPSMPIAKQLPKIPIKTKSYIEESTRKKLPIVNKSRMYDDRSIYSNNYSLNDNSIPNENSYFSTNNNSEQMLDTTTSAIDAYEISDNHVNNASCYPSSNSECLPSNDFDDSLYNRYDYFGSSLTTNYDQLKDDKQLSDTAQFDYYNQYSEGNSNSDFTNTESNTASNVLTSSSHQTSSLFTTSTTSATSFMKNTISYASKISTPITTSVTNASGTSTLTTAGNIGASITSSIGMGISKTLSSMFQTKTNQPTNESILLNSKNHTINEPCIGNNATTLNTTATTTTTSNVNLPVKSNSASGTYSILPTNIPMPFNGSDEINPDELMNEVSGNIVDYNSSDYKYIYDEYSENDYIATGDIITNKNNYNNNYNEYCSSNVDINNILDSKTDNLTLVNSSDEIGNIQSPTSASIINNKNVYCDKTSSNNAYNLSDNTLTNTDTSFNLYNNGSFSYLNGASGLISMDKEPAEPTEVYTEDYEDDYYRPNQTTSPNIMQNYNQSYQTPYYNYQEDYFNEEDEYKYLEKEREEANMEDSETNEQNQIQRSNEKKTHILRAQESISDNDFFLKHLEGGVKPSYLSKQESIIEEVEPLDEQDELEEIHETTGPGHNTGITLANTLGNQSNIAATLNPNITNRPLSILAAMTTTTTAQALSTTKQPGDIVSDMIGAAVPQQSSLNSMMSAASTGNAIGGDATAMMMAAAKLATTATGQATTTKVDDVIEDVTKKKQLGSTDENSFSGVTTRKSGVTPKQRWHWAYNKIIMQLNVSIILINLTFYSIFI